jgi:O-antigen/teichoic acid export membrane protein
MINKPQFVPSVGLMNKVTVKEIFGTSMYFFVINLAYLFYSSFDNILISHSVNAQAVAGFATVKRVYDVFPMMVALATPSFWVTNREAFLRKDMQWLNSFFHKGMLMNGAALLALVVLSLVLNVHFFTWFTHGKVAELTQLLITVVAVNAVIIINYNFYSAFFIAIDEIKRFTWFFGVFAVLSFAMKMLLLPRIGVTYTYVCNAMLYFITFFLPCYLYLRKKVVLP